MSNQYTDESIISVDPREHVRLRPGMYAGDTSNPGQLVMEVFSNALDEHNIGHGNIIEVTINKKSKDGTVWYAVVDEGQGFPIQKREDDCTIFEAAASVMNTSGKYSEDGVYSGTALGLNGIGLKLVNFLSKHFKGVTKNKGQEENIRFDDGIKADHVIRDLYTDEKDRHGTSFIWEPDEQFFDSVLVDSKYFRSFFHDMACLCPQLTIFFEDGHNPIEEIKHPKGINDFINNHLNDEIETINNRLIIQKKNGDIKLDLALTFCGNNSSHIIPYVNYGLTESGPHITAIKSTITRIINNWAKENNLLKKGEKNLDGSSIQEGMLLVCNMVTKNVAYNAQVKTAVTKIDTSFITSTLGKELELWLDNNPDAGRVIIEKALLSRKAAEAAKKAREAVKNKVDKPMVKKKLNLPSKLADCYSTDRMKCEIMIIEGDSAGGNLKEVRDNEFQAVLPVRGKVLNVETATLAAIDKNAEIQDMINAFGLVKVPGKKEAHVNPANLRYGKIILMSDADIDGAHIKNLLYTFIWNYAPELIEGGYVYAGVPPLYRLKNAKETIYLKDDIELNEFKKTHDISKFQVSRLKG